MRVWLPLLLRTPPPLSWKHSIDLSIMDADNRLLYCCSRVSSAGNSEIDECRSGPTTLRPQRKQLVAEIENLDGEEKPWPP